MKTIAPFTGRLLLCCLLFSVISFQSFSQSDKGVTLNFGASVAMPMGDTFKRTHYAGAGPEATLTVPLGFFGDITGTIKAHSFLGKKILNKDGYYKHKNVLYFLAGYRYNFNPEIESAFYVEPRIGYALIGTKNQAVCIDPQFGYYFSEKLEAAIWYQNVLTNVEKAQIGAVGITISMRFNNLF